MHHPTEFRDEPQFQGGISDPDKEKLFSELLRKRYLNIGANNRVEYPENEV